MMTKEETLDMLINDYKNGNQSAMSDYCDRIKCYECPFESGDCVDEVNNMLIDRLLKAEEHQETNLEHYASKSLTEKYGYSPFMSCDTDTLAIALKDGWEKTFNWSDPIQWLLSPYEPPKYKLSKLEYDLLECYHSGYAIKDFWQLEKMLDKGYFKDIPNDVQIEDILDNCEVID